MSYHFNSFKFHFVINLKPSQIRTSTNSKYILTLLSPAFCVFCCASIKKQSADKNYNKIEYVNICRT